MNKQQVELENQINNLINEISANKYFKIKENCDSLRELIYEKRDELKKHAEKMAKSHDWECFDRKDIIFYLNRFSKVQNQGRYQNDETDALKDIAQNSALSKIELIIELARALCCVPHGRQLGSIYSPWSDFVTYR